MFTKFWWGHVWSWTMGYIIIYIRSKLVWFFTKGNISTHKHSNWLLCIDKAIIGYTGGLGNWGHFSTQTDYYSYNMYCIYTHFALVRMNTMAGSRKSPLSSSICSKQTCNSSYTQQELHTLLKCLHSSAYMTAWQPVQCSYNKTAEFRWKKCKAYDYSSFC